MRPFLRLFKKDKNKNYKFVELAEPIFEAVKKGVACGAGGVAGLFKDVVVAVPPTNPMAWVQGTVSLLFLMSRRLYQGTGSLR